MGGHFLHQALCNANLRATRAGSCQRGGGATMSCRNASVLCLAFGPPLLDFLVGVGGSSAKMMAGLSGSGRKGDDAADSTVAFVHRGRRSGTDNGLFGASRRPTIAPHSRRPPPALTCSLTLAFDKVNACRRFWRRTICPFYVLDFFFERPAEQ